MIARQKEDLLKELIRNYQKLIFTVCYQFTKDYHESENLTQDTFLSAFNHLETLEHTNYKAWLVRIATNKCKDFLKSAYKRKTETSDMENIVLVSHERDPAEIVTEEESREKIIEICNRLKEPYKTVSKLYYVEEKSFQEIAAYMDKPVKTIQTQVYRAREKIKIMLKEEYKDGEG